MRLQAVVEDGNKAFMERRPQVDEHVAATDEVELREGRILYHVLLGKNTHFAHALADLKVGIHFRKEMPQTIRGNVLDDARRIDAVARLLYRDFADIGAEDLNAALMPFFFQELQ